MKTIVFSDSHLADKFEKVKYNFLVEIIRQADAVVINGDFWDSWFINFDDFVGSAWRKLFPLLLDKKAVYIYGNHDPEEKCDHRTSLFSIKALNSYDICLGGRDYHFEHGHNLLKGKRSLFLETYSRIVGDVDTGVVPRIIHHFINGLEQSAFKVYGFDRTTNTPIAKKSNNILKRSNNGSYILVCGDTHCGEIDKLSRFINTGCVVYGNASYVVIDDGVPRLVRVRY